VELEIKPRARRYGYLYWGRQQDVEMSRLLGKRDAIDIIFMGASHGQKRIDWKYRRISIGWRWTRSLPQSKKVFLLHVSKFNKLEIECR
jgi:hypothetical protein